MDNKDQLNEANATLSINDLNSSDMQTLSQILSLAGQADQGGAEANPMGGITPMAGPDGNLGSNAGSMDMGTTEISVGTMEDTTDAFGEDDMDIGGMDDMVDDMDVMEDIARLSGLDPLAESEDEALEEGDEQLEEEVVVEAEEDNEEEIIEEAKSDAFDDADDEASEDEVEDFVKDHEEEMHESGGTPGNEMRESLDAIDAILEADDEELEESEEQLDENEHGHYNFDLDEDAAAELASPGIGDNREFGPYPNEDHCMTDARKEIPHAVRDQEVQLIHKPDGWYWVKTGKVQPQPKQAAQPVVAMEAEQSVEDLANQLNEQFEAFMKKGD